jgi:hypothetical protein
MITDSCSADTVKPISAIWTFVWKEEEELQDVLSGEPITRPSLEPRAPEYESKQLALRRLDRWSSEDFEGLDIADIPCSLFS